MKLKLAPLFLALPLMAQGPFTSVNPATQIKIEPAIPYGGLAILQGTMKVVRYDSNTLRIDTSQNPPVLSCVLPPLEAQVIHDGAEYPDVLTAPLPSFTLKNTPLALLIVTRGGLVLRLGYDYTVSGRVITFASGAATPGPGDVVTFRYLW